MTFTEWQSIMPHAQTKIPCATSYFTMSNQIVAFITFGIILFHGCEMIYGTFVVPPLCKPGVIEDMPHHIKKVCLALENSDQLTSALESFINREASCKLSNNIKQFKI
ncbi:hypothetical protein GQX74_013428 [Glossina fuscipes]|nr:hypothetical protein GQX74_013428 [Glossina fuscipes]